MSRLLFVAIVAIVAGCAEQPSSRQSLLCECFSQAAYDVITAESSPTPDAPQKCCGKCGGTGRVKSGDGLAWVACPCPETCECKQAKCKDGKCPQKK